MEFRLDNTGGNPVHVQVAGSGAREIGSKQTRRVHLNVHDAMFLKRCADKGSALKIYAESPQAQAVLDAAYRPHAYVPSKGAPGAPVQDVDMVANSTTAGGAMQPPAQGATADAGAPAMQGATHVPAGGETPTGEDAAGGAPDTAPLDWPTNPAGTGDTTPAPAVATVAPLRRSPAAPAGKQATKAPKAPPKRRR